MEHKKIVVLDESPLTVGGISWERLTDCADVTIYESSTPEEAVERMAGKQMVLTNKVRMTRELIEAHPELEYIGMMATGYNIIDLEATKQHHITVCNVPSYGTEAVAQHTWALLLEMTNQVAMAQTLTHKKLWSFSPEWSVQAQAMMELKDKTLGIIGYGNIGKEVARLAQAFRMKVLALRRPSTPKTEQEGISFVDWDTLLQRSDIITLHCPLTSDTWHRIGEKEIQKMKPGVLLLNTSRGGLIDEQALWEALQSGQVGAVGLDVTEKEPLSLDSPLLQCSNCYITPHIAWGPTETRNRLVQISIDNARAYLEGHPQNIVQSPYGVRR